jgi:hypothetical protein
MACYGDSFNLNFAFLISPNKIYGTDRIKLSLLTDTAMKGYTSEIQCLIFRSKLTNVSNEHKACIFKYYAEHCVLSSS